MAELLDMEARLGVNCQGTIQYKTCTSFWSGFLHRIEPGADRQAGGVANLIHVVQIEANQFRRAVDSSNPDTLVGQIESFFT